LKESVQAKVAEQIAALNTKRGMKDYEEKTPEEIRKVDADKLKGLTEEQSMLQQHLQSMLDWSQQRQAS